jgi:heme A synthase
MTHFEDMTLFAALVSLALAFLTKRTTIERIKYAIYAFLGFMVVAIAIGWLMYPLSR